MRYWFKLKYAVFAEYIAVPQHILYRIPEGVDYNQAAMVDPAAVAFHAVGLTPVALNDTAIVVGAGMIGLFVIQALRIAGCGCIITLDLQEDRLALAKKLGADVVLNPKVTNFADHILELSKNRGADLAFEVVGIDSAIQTAINGLRKGGTLTLVGNLKPNVQIPLQEVVTRQLRLQGSCAIAGEYQAVLDMIERGAIQMDEILSATAPLSEDALWFNILYQ